MPAPQIRVFVDFDSDTAFEINPLILDSLSEGILGTNTLGSGTLPVEVTDLVERVAIRRGRNRITGKFEFGSAYVQLYDQNGDWNPANLNGAYYPKLIPLRQIIIFATYNNANYFLFSGFIESYNTKFWQGNEDVSRVTLKCVDSFRLFAGALVTTVAGGTAGQDSGTRVNKILNAVNFPISQRNIDTGDSTLQADPGTQRSTLEALQQVENSEFGGIFLDGQGLVNFKNRTAMVTSPAFAAYSFADDGSAISYDQADVAFDDATLINDVTVTRLGGSPQNVIDQTSIDTYFVHSATRSDILVQSDTESLNQARAILATRKDPEPRVDSIALNLYDDADPNKPLSGIDIELLDGVSVLKTMPGSSSFTQSSVVIGIHHDITTTSWITRLFTSEPLLAGFVIGSSIDGIIGEDVLSY